MSAKKECNEELHHRHCMVVHAYYPEAETRVQRQAMALFDHGAEVDVICLQEPGEPAVTKENGVQVYRLPVRRHKNSGLMVQMAEYLTFFVLAFIRLTRLHRRRRYNVIQVHNLPDFLVFVALIPKLAGARVILDLHDLMPEFYAERFQRSMNSLPVLLVRWQEWVSCYFADHIITVTELWRQALIGRGQPGNKITVVMNVADDRIFHRNAAIAEPGSREHGFRLIYHGTMAQRYGLDIALRAIAMVRQRAPDIHLTLHGNGEYRQSLQNLAQELGLQNHVEFSIHSVTTEDLPKLIRQANLGIVPYRNGVFTGDILPTKLMEYAALGIPSIAASTRAIAAYFNETAVQLFRPGDVEDLSRSILLLYTDRDRLTTLAHTVEEFNQRYNWPDQRLNYLRLVNRLMRRR